MDQKRYSRFLIRKKGEKKEGYYCQRCGEWQLGFGNLVFDPGCMKDIKICKDCFKKGRPIAKEASELNV